MARAVHAIFDKRVGDKRVRDQGRAHAGAAVGIDMRWAEPAGIFFGVSLMMLPPSHQTEPAFPARSLAMKVHKGRRRSVRIEAVTPQFVNKFTKNIAIL
ncbi:hypothetical protein KUL25_08860 [Rhodobacteraceae bacterium N5(2021)]|uniref:Uncharacterized protein n=1 Tax=Gymnodinialimonas phycosphaerae TaxID=2841589 RepID=A0A975TY66_9RHOB|nr:hypothetical protein [Gymnodinialimonas phycosphaerae]MBY4892871.1 hypothetical protein [Gymnodinialimonas phycosphaerae]